MKNNKSIKCNVDECMYNDVDNGFCTLDDINVDYDEDMELDAVCASYVPNDEFDEDTENESPDDNE